MLDYHFSDLYFFSTFFVSANLGIFLWQPSQTHPLRLLRFVEFRIMLSAALLPVPPTEVLPVTVHQTRQIVTWERTIHTSGVHVPRVHLYHI